MFVRSFILALGVTLAGVLVLIGVAFMSGAIFEVQPHQRVVVFRSDVPVREVGPGFNWRIPFIEDPRYCDMRNQKFELSAVQSYVGDLTLVSIDGFVIYSVADCTKLLRQTHSQNFLDHFLGTRVRPRLRRSLERFSFAELAEKRKGIIAEADTRIGEIAQSFGLESMEIDLSFSRSKAAPRRSRPNYRAK